VVADKAGVKDLTNKLVPLILALSGAKKLFLSPMSRYWLNPCCGDPTHLVNYRVDGFLPRRCSHCRAERLHQGLPVHAAYLELPGPVPK
jgi:hypothetical protein